jgi:pimeloyl-ACP methyl ester carboxylesterase
MIQRRPPALSAGIRINSWAWPGAENEQLLLIHGGRDQSRSWDFYAEGLRGRFAIVSADLRGHGDSGWSIEGNYGLADMTADMGEVLQSMPGEVSIVGHSLGGHIALRLAALFPKRVKAVAAIECLELPEVRGDRGVPLAQRLRTWFDERKSFEQKAPPVYPGLAAATERMAERFPDLHSDLIEHLARFSVRKVPGGVTWKFDYRTRSRPPIDSDASDFDAMLTSIRCPVQLFYGDQSFVPLPQPSRLALLKQASLIRYADAGHWLHHQRLEQFYADTAAFLTKRSLQLA